MHTLSETNYKLALAHDSLTQFGGAERVVTTLTKIFPQAPLYTLTANKNLRNFFPHTKIITSRYQCLITMLPDFRYALPLIPLACRSLNFSGFKLILSSSSGFIKGLKKPLGSVHVNYCHTPTRFLWINPDYIRQETNQLQRLAVTPILKMLRRWDMEAVKSIDYFIANSREVQQRIKNIYNRDSVVIYPGVDVNFWHKTKATGEHYLLAGRLHAHKNNEVVIQACNQLRLPLRVVGTGRHLAYLKSIAGPTVTFLGRITDQELRDEYSSAKAYFFPQNEDFGLMPLEAAACSTPTIALAAGGALETIIDGITGTLFAKATVEEISEAILRFNQLSINPQTLSDHAAEFSEEVFAKNILAYLHQVYPA